ncbi:single-stranded DNA-binding protein [bacterium]|nr:MAG: single-stranded DNA-binding protein [bacterium]
MTATVSTPKADLSQIPVTVTFTDPLGGTIVTTVGLQELLQTKRLLGKRGYVCGEIPRGGIRRPLAEHDRFDWSLIGATHATVGDDEGLWCRGYFWKKRHLAAQTTGKKMPELIKYSRGASPTDPREIVESEEDAKGYVTLIIFRGRGPVNRAYLRPEDQ